ncbi:MAG: TonB-dependent receptor, partial [Pseudomonadota bacterium]
YNRGIHTFFGGYEREEFEAFNLFIQEAEGEYRFSSVQDFIDGTPNRITYENAAPSNNPNDAASTFEYAINTAYLQDKISFDDYGVQVIIGLRYDWYTSSDVPAANARFAERYGFSNQQNFDGEGLLQPRFGLTWDVSDRLSLRGGAGVYSGGNPNVWLSNNYSNNGITQVEVQDRTLDDGGPTLFDIDFNGSGRPIFDIPQNLFDAVGNPTEQADSGVNALDPNFEIPSDLKIAIGATWNFDAGFLGEDYTLNADYLYSKQNNAPIIRDATLERIGTAPDGRPIYRGIDRRDSACAVDPVNCEGRTQDFILTNVEGAEGSQNAFSVGISKSYDWGFDWSLGYAYTESSDVSPMTSSVAFSNFSNIAVSDPNNPGRAESNYEIPNRFTLRMSYQNAFFGDNMTKITVFGSANEGRPFTFTFNNGFAFGDSVGFEDRHLLYVPTGPGDPLVTFADPGVEQAFFDFVAAQGLDEFSGQILPRNAFHSDWWTKFDVKIEQEFPGGGDNKLAGFLVIENIGNLFNDEWGVLNESGFPRFQGVVDANINNGVYEYDNFFEPSPQGRVVDASLWEVRVGFRYDFAF